MSYSPFIILSVLIFVSMLINFYLAIQLRHLRIRANKLLEEKAKALEEADHYAELANNPLGPIMNKNAQPLNFLKCRAFCIIVVSDYRILPDL